MFSSWLDYLASITPRAVCPEQMMMMITMMMIMLILSELVQAVDDFALARSKPSLPATVGASRSLAWCGKLSNWS